jgi:hypothetical protein
MDYEFRPIVSWIGAPTPHHRRQRSRFDSTYSQTLDLLERELRHLCAKQVIIQTYHFIEDLRRDGLPRANARVPQSPGVILSFNSKHGALSYPCDTFTKWEDNLRAIALALEALRTVDRYGVTKTGEQYRGWTALPPADSKTLEQEAAEFLSAYWVCSASDILRDKSSFLSTYKAAVLVMHPDKGGKHEDFVRLQQFANILKKKHGIN